MDQRDIKTFLAIVRNHSFSKAAELLYTSQTTISHRIQTMETELGFSLFMRNPGQRTISLTSQGEQFLLLAEQWDALWENSQHIRSANYRTPLLVGCGDQLTHYMFPSFFQDFSSSADSIMLTIRIAHSSEIIDMVDRKDLDVGFINMDPYVKSVVAIPFLKDSVVMICPRGEYSQFDAIHPEHLDQADEVRLRSSMKIEQWRDQYWPESKQPYINVDTYSLATQFLNQPRRWAICPRFVAESLIKTHPLDMHEFAVEGPHRISYLIYHESMRPDKTEAIRVFVEAFKKRYHTLHDDLPDHFPFT